MWLNVHHLSHLFTLYEPNVLIIKPIIWLWRWADRHLNQHIFSNEYYWCERTNKWPIELHINETTNAFKLKYGNELLTRRSIRILWLAIIVSLTICRKVSFTYLIQFLIWSKIHINSPIGITINSVYTKSVINTESEISVKIIIIMNILVVGLIQLFEQVCL